MGDPLLSFVIPTFNYGNYLGECLRSIVEQTYRRIEIFVLDDASTDDTPAVMKEFKDARVRYVRQPRNIGFPRNFNAGLEQCQGDFIWGISADDCLADETAVARALAEFRKDESLSIVWSAPQGMGASVELIAWAYHGPEELSLKRPDLARRVMTINSICAPCVVSRAELYRKCGGYPEELKFMPDWYCWFFFGLISNARYLPRPLAYYRIHDSMMTKQFATQKRAQRVIESIRLRFAMLELTEREPSFHRDITAALRWDLRDFLMIWMYYRAEREFLYNALAGDLRLGVSRQGRGVIGAFLGEELRRAARAIIAEAIRDRRPHLAVNALLLQTQIHSLCNSVRKE